MTTIHFNVRDLTTAGLALLNIVRNQALESGAVIVEDDGNVTATIYVILGSKHEGVRVNVVNVHGQYSMWRVPMGHVSAYNWRKVSAANTWNNIGAAFHKWCADTGFVPGLP